MSEPDEREDAADTKKTAAHMAIDASGWLIGFIFGWIVFDDFIFGLLFAVMFGVATSVGQRNIKR